MTPALEFVSQSGVQHAGSIPEQSAFDDWLLTTAAQSDLLVGIGTSFGPFFRISDSSNNLLVQRLANGGDRTSDLTLVTPVSWNPVISNAEEGALFTTGEFATTRGLAFLRSRWD